MNFDNLTSNIYNFEFNQFFEFFTRLGDWFFYLGFIFALLFFRRYRLLGLKIGILVFFSYIIQFVLKFIFKVPRIYELNVHIIPKINAVGYGFPSGHALVAGGFWTYLMLKLKNKYIWPIGIFFIFIIGISRVNLGVHSFFEVFCGWILGITIGILFYFFSEKY